MSIAAKLLRGGVVAMVMATVIGGIAAPAAHADWYGHHRREWRDHDARERVWRDRRYDSRYYYGNQVYVAPPVVYGPPPPPPGVGLFFNIR